jgi:hypothetical protein
MFVTGPGVATNIIADCAGKVAGLPDGTSNHLHQIDADDDIVATPGRAHYALVDNRNHPAAGASLNPKVAAQRSGRSVKLDITEAVAHERVVRVSR